MVKQEVFFNITINAISKALCLYPVEYIGLSPKNNIVTMLLGSIRK